jgi:phenylacetate-coenzyme A ligase PaaK-like adenylate-forming protein
MASPDLTVPEPDPEHEARACAAIARALRETPFYAKGATPRPIPEPGMPLREALARLPLLFKHDLRATLPKQWVPAGRDVKAELASGAIELVETSGSTGDRTRILWDKGWWLRQEVRAFETHPAVARSFAGASGRYQEAILTTPVCGLGSCHTGEMTVEERTEEFRLFLNTKADPTYWKPQDMARILDELHAHETSGLESDPMYLAVLARFAAAQKRTIEVKDFIVLTYAFTSKAHERSIRRAYAGLLLQLYGASEVGVLFMEGEDGKLHHCPLTTHVELLPIKVATPGARNVALVVVTTLDRVVQPLVRFVVGDLVSVDAGASSRFTTVPPLSAVEGRLTDALVRPDGAIVTAGAIDRALMPVTGIAFYQVNQPTPAEVLVDVVPEPDAAVVSAVEAEVARRLAPLCEGLELRVRTAAAIAAEPSGKFRVSRRHFPMALGKLFDGCDGVML